MRRRKGTVDGYCRWDAADKRDAVDNRDAADDREVDESGVVTV
jgi:hypothetical protein